MNRRERIAGLLPAPLAGSALLLVALILLTPIFLSGGQPAAGSLLSQAELIVDRAPGSNVTHFYVRGVGTTTRYATMTVDVAGNFSWTGRFPTAPLAWTVGANDTEVLSLALSTSVNPVALNISVLYRVSGGSALYVGELAVYVGGGPGGATVYLAPSTPGLAVGSSTPVLDLPLVVPLVNVGGGP